MGLQLTRRLILLAAASAVAVACESPTDERAATAVDLVSGNNQTGTAGANLASPLVVKVLDSRGHPVEGRTVTFRVTGGGGSVLPLTVRTGGDGKARTHWTLGTRLDSTHIVEATIREGLRAEFTARAELPENAQLYLVSGSAQTGIVGTELAEPLAVGARLADGRPLQGVAVAWTPASANGTLTPEASVTDQAGVSRARWLLPTVAGTQVGKVTLSSRAVYFSASARPGAPARAEVVWGMGQSQRVGGPLEQPVIVRVWDRFDNRADAVEVGWSAEGGGMLSSASSRTGDTGDAGVRWTLGGIAGTQRVRIDVPTLAPLFVSAEARIGEVARIVIDQRDVVVKHQTPFTLTASAYDAYNNKYPATSLSAVIYWLTPDIRILRSSSSAVGTFATPGIGTARVIAGSFNTAAEDTVFVKVVP